MKKILKLLFVLFLVVSISGCKKIEKISYTTFNEYFANKSEYRLNDTTDQYDVNIRRFTEAGEGNIQIFYIEFDNAKNAQKYLTDMYLIDETNKVKEKKDYTYIKNTKGKYMKLYKVDNLIIIGKTSDKKYKFKVNKVLKDIGY